MSPWSQGTRVTGNSRIGQVPGCGASFGRNGSAGMTLYPSHDTHPLQLTWLDLPRILPVSRNTSQKRTGDTVLLLPGTCGGEGSQKDPTDYTIRHCPSSWLGHMCSDTFSKDI